MAQHNIQIRFNTDKEKISKELPAWRVLVDGIEYLAKDVRIEVPMWTSEDILPTGQKKWHLSCEGDVIWDEQQENCVIR
jgi:hypothetical protein